MLSSLLNYVLYQVMDCLLKSNADVMDGSKVTALSVCSSDSDNNNAHETASFFITVTLGFVSTPAIIITGDKQNCKYFLSLTHN